MNTDNDRIPDLFRQRRQQLWLEAIRLLNANQPEQATEIVNPHAHVDRRLANLYGVCMMRCGRIREAVQTYRHLVLSNNGIDYRSDVPATFVSNFATALFLEGNVSGALQALDELSHRGQIAPAKKLQEAIDSWFCRLSIWQRASFWLGGQPRLPTTLEFPPGVVTDEPGTPIPSDRGPRPRAA